MPTEWDSDQAMAEATAELPAMRQMGQRLGIAGLAPNLIAAGAGKQLVQIISASMKKLKQAGHGDPVRSLARAVLAIDDLDQDSMMNAIAMKLLEIEYLIFGYKYFGGRPEAFTDAEAVPYEVNHNIRSPRAWRTHGENGLKALGLL